MQFRGEYWFLSNMFPSVIELKGVRYSCAEAAFQAFKVPENKRSMFSGINGFEAKRLGRSVKLPADWNKLRDYAMEIVILAKFVQNSDLKEKLLATGNQEIAENNTWGDTYWGVCNGKGKNVLGTILMNVRSKLRG